jgi:hypothetical protein
MPSYSTLSDQIQVFKDKVDDLTSSGDLTANDLLLLAEALSVIGAAIGVQDIVAATQNAVTTVQDAGVATVATVSATANGTAVTNLQNSYDSLNGLYTNLQPRVTSLEATSTSQTSAIATASALAGLGGWNAWVTHTSGNKQLVPNDRIFVIPAANMTLTLPVTPSIGQAVRIVDAAGTAGTTNFTIGRNGQPIMGTAQDMTVNTNSARLHLVYVDSTRGWRLV